MIASDSLALARKARQALLEKKGENVLLFDVREVSEVTDYYLVASGASSPQLRAMFEEVQHALKGDGVLCYRRCGDVDSGWLVLDYVDVVIHILSTEARTYYAFEDLWAQVPRVP